ncbi:MAG TPA: DEAD/DEAH box helicase family protein [Oligoflexus sp.]|uniref:type I restriction endonuclease subunit R n=1 Tax=Oligoflexus sp. TaxID=1971216 RepID=UPI002D3006E6|nr:DEAD/DEAH box helicase family protein [Oligoflexus sp.]HYX32756.1 DEAD/DEAH box helicase family protein [Oligoflexus sp.]
MVNQHPEQIARDAIDERLSRAGWKVQEFKKLDWEAGLGIAIKEYPTDAGPADYALFVDQTPVGVIEAKRDDEGLRITTAEDQSAGYAGSKFKYIDNQPLPFRYEATGILTRFTDIRDPKPRSREIFSFHRPEKLHSWVKEGRTLRSRVQDLSNLDQAGLRECQFKAITNLEMSFKANRPRALVQMATGAGKTFTAITSVYRLLKFAKAKRVLFLVDTKNLGEQAEQEFMAFKPIDDNRKFTELYNVTRLKSKHIPTDSQVYISTIQRLYSILQGEELDEKLEEANPNEIEMEPRQPQKVVYNERLPIEFFDFIIIDECHRSIYNLWKQVLDYYDAFLIGLTATPDSRTFGFFNENVVSEYSHESAVTDGVNVGFDVYLIESEITQAGSILNANEYVERREKLSRKKRWEQLDEDRAYKGTELDRDVVNPSQIRQIIRTFRDKLPEIFPGRKEMPKTLIFAKTDSHADDIIAMVREEFEQGNDFCKKITYQAKEDPKSILTQFRNDFNPRIAVTVDMIATGTDVKPIECLLFMRDVRSKNYYEQMLGRGTRTLGEDDLKRISPSANTAKTHFVVIDAIGVSKSLKSNTRPLERNRSVSLKDLLSNVLMGSRDEGVYSSLASRLTRLDREISVAEKEKFQKLAKGSSVSDIVHAILRAHDPDAVEEEARRQFELKEQEDPTPEQSKTTKETLIKKASSMLSGELNEFIVQVRQSHDQIIDMVNRDNISYAGWDASQADQAKVMVTEFQKFIELNKNEIMALKILYNEPHRRKEITYKMIREIFDTLKTNKPNLAPFRVFQAYASMDKVQAGNPKSELVAIVSLIRRVTGVDAALTDHQSKVDKNFQDWVFRRQSGKTKFNKDQMDWLRMIKDHVASSFHIERDDLDLAPFNDEGGLARMYELFGPQIDSIICEMNEALVS